MRLLLYPVVAAETYSFLRYSSDTGEVEIATGDSDNRSTVTPVPLFVWYRITMYLTDFMFLLY